MTPTTMVDRLPVFWSLNFGFDECRYKRRWVCTLFCTSTKWMEWKAVIYQQLSNARDSSWHLSSFILMPNYGLFICDLSHAILRENHVTKAGLPGVMPSYFFHLKLELYPSCSSSLATAQQAPRSAPPKDTNNPTFLPRPDSDIFKTQLPAHKTTKWTSYQFQSKHDRQDSSEQNSGSVTPRSRPQSSAGRQEAHGDALLLPERNVALKKGSTSPALSPAKPSSEAASRDWRFGPVSIESIDMVSTSDEQAKEKAAKHGKGSNTGLHTKGVYLPSDPKTTHVGWGVVHLYRDTQETAALEQDGHGSRHMSAKEADGFSVDDCSTLCILAVPSWMMPSDLLGFVGDQTREDVSHFRLIRTGRANKYMVLMKFRSPKKARDWQKLWNGKLFSAMEVCPD